MNQEERLEFASSQEQVGQQKQKQAEQAYEAKNQDPEHGPLPQVDLNTFVLSLSSSVLAHLGEVPDPSTGETSQNLEVARHTIDILGVLEEKTKGNLTLDEENLLKNLLFELRMKYVQKA
ncbi:MAG: DUF1844 domain-containing protein [Desulfohalobiaceae bacterium]